MPKYWQPYNNYTMAIRSRSVLKGWFSTAKKPTQEQFHDWIDSFFHTSDAIPYTNMQAANDPVYEAKLPTFPGSATQFLAGNRTWQTISTTTITGVMVSASEINVLKDLNVSGGRILFMEESKITNSSSFIYDNLYNQLQVDNIVGSSNVNGVINIQGTKATGNNTANAAINFLVGENGATNAMTIYNSGNIGMGSNPSSNKLSVLGNVSISGYMVAARTLTTATSAGAILQSSSFSSDTIPVRVSPSLRFSSYAWNTSASQNRSNIWDIYTHSISGSTTSSNLVFIPSTIDGSTTTTPVVYISSAGSLGVGKEPTAYKLDVAGDCNLSSTFVYRINGESILTATGLGSTVVSSSLTSVGTIASGTWNASVVQPAYGGTGIASYTKGDIIAATASTALAKLPIGTNGYVLTANDSEVTGLKWDGQREVITVAVSDETSNLTGGTAKVTFRMPFAMTLTEVRASVNTAPVGSTIIIDINEGGASILSTELTIDANEKTSKTAATSAVISDTSLADDAEITIDIDQVGSSTPGKGLKVTLIGKRT